MEGSSPESALARIDAAIARLEAVAARPPAAAGDSGDNLAARHQALRDAVSQALGQLDGLIAGASSGLSPE
jgi:predicted component of type VI protein secretion system